MEMPSLAASLGAMSSSNNPATGGGKEGEEEEEVVSEGVPLTESEVSIASEPDQTVGNARGQSAEPQAEGVEGESAGTQTPR